jgi:AcrR family transcriptional regulator
MVLKMAEESRKTREFDRREHDILDAALKLFSGERWESVTVEKIAEQTGIGKGTVYKHFASKDEIYARLALDFFCGLLSRCRELPIEENPELELRNAFREVLHYHLEHGEYRNVRQYVFRAGFWERLGQQYIEAFEKLDAEFASWADDLIERGMTSGVFSRQPLLVVRMGLDALVNGAVDQLWGERCWMEIDPDTYIGQIVDFAVNSLKADRQE